MEERQTIELQDFKPREQAKLEAHNDVVLLRRNAREANLERMLDFWRKRA